MSKNFGPVYVLVAGMLIAASIIYAARQSNDGGNDEIVNRLSQIQIQQQLDNERQELEEQKQQLAADLDSLRSDREVLNSRRDNLNRQPTDWDEIDSKTVQTPNHPPSYGVAPASGHVLQGTIVPPQTGTPPSVGQFVVSSGAQQHVIELTSPGTEESLSDKAEPTESPPSDDSEAGDDPRRFNFFLGGGSR